MSGRTISTIGLYSSDPWSPRCDQLAQAFQKVGVKATHILPWKVKRIGTTGTHEITHDDHDLTSLDALLVLDLGGNDIGTFFNRVGVLSALQELGVEIINPVNSILQMRNKAECMRKLVTAGLPVPITLITESIEDAAEFVHEHFPCVLKPITGFGGTGVQLIHRDFDREHLLDFLKFHSQLFGKGAFLLQEYISNHGFDIRALVVDNEVVATMQRVSPGGLVTNIHAGGTPRRNDVDVTDIAIQAAKSVRGRLVGVDIIPDASGDLWVLEVNATPGWAGLQAVTDFDLALRIATSLSIIH
ncbi:MAG: RimK family alpha-L-glutamate ligase [Candidatus Thorarchaeota archaeon]|nr:RimK family alpha-L-glutamate ligase [Candidatus Thorarchaeota archaeon]